LLKPPSIINARITAPSAGGIISSMELYLDRYRSRGVASWRAEASCHKIFNLDP
jgi:hypothetical protein